MPIVNIKITRDGASREQKAALIARSTQMLHEVLGKDPALTFVVIEEVEAEDWGVAGLPASEFRSRGMTLTAS
jgi:4-oxalocrotonate tautomerase